MKTRELHERNLRIPAVVAAFPISLAPAQPPIVQERVEALKASSCLDPPRELGTVDVRFGTLNSNATHVALTVLDAKGRDLEGTVESSGCRRR